MEIWKIKNISKVRVPVAVAAGSAASKGVIMEPGQFCLGEGRITSSLDAQSRRKFIEIEKGFDNSILDLKIGETYEESALIIASKKISEYSK